MSKIVNLFNSGRRTIKTGVVNVNSRNVYPTTLTATASGTSLGVELTDSYEFFNVAQTSLSTDLLILPQVNATTGIGTIVELYAISAFSAKAGADASGLTINGGADTASVLVPAGAIARFQKTTSTNWIATISTSTGSVATDNQPQSVELSLTNAQVLALRATPITLIAAPGTGKVIELISAYAFFDYTAAYTETADNIGFKYTNGSGAEIASFETTGFLTATADTFTKATLAAAANIAKTGGDNQALVLHNNGDGEFGGGNAANVLRVRALYRVIPAGW